MSLLVLDGRFLPTSLDVIGFDLVRRPVHTWSTLWIPLMSCCTKVPIEKQMRRTKANSDLPWLCYEFISHKIFRRVYIYIIHFPQQPAPSAMPSTLHVLSSAFQNWAPVAPVAGNPQAVAPVAGRHGRFKWVSTYVAAAVVTHIFHLEIPWSNLNHRS